MKKNDNLHEADGNSPEMDNVNFEAQDTLENAMVDEATDPKQATEGAANTDTDDASEEPMKEGS
ncbi:MAG: hypothetical protein QMB11_08460, partial [Nonlabens sp.]|uniref:hypothetical protein n=1 Tax=Nonlabens sp. TaxID=1888209 RepID=UPI0035A610B6